MTRILSTCVALIWLAGCASNRAAPGVTSTVASQPAAPVAAAPESAPASSAQSSSNMPGTGGSASSGIEAPASTPLVAPLSGSAVAPATATSAPSKTLQASLSASALSKGPEAAAVEAGLLPPSAIGQSVTQTSGCLSNPGAALKANVQPAKAKGGLSPYTGATEDVKVTAAKGGLLMSHALSHNCCQKAEVTSEFRDGRVVITEFLSGRSCRCECESQVRTAVGLPSGTYPVAVEVMTPGSRRVAHETTLTIP